MNDDKRRKRSWREVDRNKDRSAHRRDENLASSPAHLRQTKTYKAELDRFFDSGTASSRIKNLMGKGLDKVGLQEEDSPEKTKLVRRIRSAETFDDFVKAVDALREQYGLPNDVEILGRVLEHPAIDAIKDALVRLRDFPRRLGLTDLKSLNTRIDALAIASDDTEVLDLIEAVRAKL